MDARTLEALEKSIAHHEANARVLNPEDARFGCASCALCELFRHSNFDCDGCPVKLATGFDICFRTPYHICVDEHNKWCLDPTDNGAAYRAAEQLEVEFLKSLRPAKADLGEVAAFVGAALIVGQLLFWGQLLAGGPL